MKKHILIAALIFSSACFGQRFRVNGQNWVKTIQASDISDAGNDYISSYESKSNQSKITVSKNNNYTDLYIWIYKVDDKWHPDLNLQIRRTNNRSNISNGTQYQTVTNNYGYFFELYGNASRIPIQYKISGLSVLLPVESYSTQIVFTIWDW